MSKLFFVRLIFILNVNVYYLKTFYECCNLQVSRADILNVQLIFQLNSECNASFFGEKMQIRHFGKCRDKRLVIQSDITLTFITFVIGMFSYLYDIFITQVKRFFQIYRRFLINRDKLIFA